MRALHRLGRSWHRFNQKHGRQMLLVLLLIVVMGVVGFLMYMLTSLKFRARW